MPRKTETARANFTMKAAKNDVAAIWLKPQLVRLFMSAESLSTSQSSAEG